MKNSLASSLFNGLVAIGAFVKKYLQSENQTIELP